MQFMDNTLELIQTILFYAIPILFAITLHEVAHGWVANKLGDPTAKMMGRLTLNPIKHIDPIGTILVPALLLWMKSSFLFGWAKPVPVTWENLRKPRRDAALVALAGPMANLIMALIWVTVLKIGSLQGIKAFLIMGQIGMVINLLLMVLNLIPIPPLDGSRIVSSLLPRKAAIAYNRIEPFGFFILIGLLLLGLLSMVLLPAVTFLASLLATLFQL